MNKKNENDITILHAETLSIGIGKPIVPIVFTSQGLMSAKGLNEFPFEFAQDTNMAAKESGFFNSENLKNHEIYSLKQNNAFILTSQLSNYIIHQSFMNFCAAFNCSKYYKYFYEIPVLQKVKDKIYNDESINTFINFSGITEYNPNMSDNEKETIMDKMLNLVNQLNQLICNDFCYGADEAITDYIMIVNQDINGESLINLFDEVIKDYPGINDVCSASPHDISTIIAMALKKFMRDIIDNLLITAISPIIMSVVSGAIFNNVNIYGDYLYYDMRAAMDQINDNIPNKVVTPVPNIPVKYNF